MPVAVKKGATDVLLDTDEPARPDVTAEHMARLRPAFSEDGSVTEGNASGINGGAGGVGAIILINLIDELHHWAGAMVWQPCASGLSKALRSLRKTPLLSQADPYSSGRFSRRISCSRGGI